LTGELTEKHVVSCFLECDARILILRRSELVGSVQEETGLCPEDVELVKKGSPLEAEDEGVRWVVHPYLFHIKKRDKVKIDWEHCDQRWIKPEDIGNYQTVPMLKETLAKVYKF
jgi:8-oxo-dGTP diphosphatase